MRIRSVAWAAVLTCTAATVAWLALRRPEVVAEGESSGSAPAPASQPPLASGRTGSSEDGSTGLGVRPEPVASDVDGTPLPAPTLEERVEAARAEARRWLDARRAAEAAGDRAAEDAARARWEAVRKGLLEAVRHDLGASVALLDALAAMPAEDEAFAIGRLLPFLFADGFETHLVRTLRGSGPLRARRLALVALRGRGLAAADAAERVAAVEPDPLLRGEATDELGTHLADPVVRPRTARIHGTITARLDDADAGVRRAAVRALLAARQPPASPEQEDAVRRIAADDPDASLRAMATVLRDRWAAAR